MLSETDIMMEIYIDLQNQIEQLEASKKRINNIKKHITTLNNNYFDVNCSGELYDGYLSMFDDVYSYNEIIRNLELLKADVQHKIVNRCNHEWVIDTLDIDPDKSQHICYCVKCELTKK